MNKSDSTRVLIRIDDHGNATVMLNRPEAHNAFDPEMVRALTDAWTGLAKNTAVRAVVITGSGKNFCAGADIVHMRQSAQFSRARNYQAASATARMLHALYTLNKPTVAAVHGAVRGGGCGIVAACDIAIAARTSTFRLSEVKIGVIPAMISPYVIRAIGERQSRRYMLSGEEFDAAEAWRIGLVHEIVEAEELADSVGTMLGQLYSSGPKAVQAIKQLIPASARSPIGPGIITATARRIAAIRATPEAQEGLSAFLEKRKPAWAESAKPRAAKKR